MYLASLLLDSKRPSLPKVEIKYAEISAAFSCEKKTAVLKGNKKILPPLFIDEKFLNEVEKMVYWSQLM